MQGPLFFFDSDAYGVEGLFVEQAEIEGLHGARAEARIAELWQMRDRALDQRGIGWGMMEANPASDEMPESLEEEPTENNNASLTEYTVLAAHNGSTIIIAVWRWPTHYATWNDTW